MKQSSIQQNGLLGKSQKARPKFYRQKKPQQRAMNSPRIIARKKQSKEIPNNAFARKYHKQQNSSLRYLSPKKSGLNQINSFFNDQTSNQQPQDIHSQKLMPNLNFRKINSQKVVINTAQLSLPRNLLEDIRQGQWDSAGNDPRSFISQTLQRNKAKTGEKTGQSLETMAQSPSLFQIKIFEQIIKSCNKQNQVLSIQNQSLKAQNKSLKMRSQQLQTHLQNVQFKLSNLVAAKKHIKIQKLQTVQTGTNPQVDSLRQQLYQVRSQLALLSRQKQELLKLKSIFQQTNQDHQQQLTYKLNTIRELQCNIGDIKADLSEKCQYSKCLQDVILELNQKILLLKQQNQQNIQLVQQKSYKLQQAEIVLQQHINTIRLYQLEISQSHRKISQLFSQQHDSLTVYKVQNSSSSKQSFYQSELIVFFKQEIQSLQAFLKDEKQLNQTLKKQISYRQIDLTLLRKNHYESEKQIKEIQKLNNKNKKLVRRFNQITQENSQIKQQLLFSKNKQKKQTATKKYPGTLNLSSGITISMINNQDLCQNSKAPNLNGKQKLQHLYHKYKQNPSIRNNKFMDSEEEFSFKLSPEKI